MAAACSFQEDMVIRLQTNPYSADFQDMRWYLVCLGILFALYVANVGLCSTAHKYPVSQKNRPPLYILNITVK